MRQEFSAGEAQFQALINTIQPKWQNEVGHEVAQKKLADFIQNAITSYENKRDIPSVDGTSQLSRFLRTGEISIREVYHRVLQEAPDSEGKMTFIKELCWRDFYHMIYAAHPEQKNLEIQPRYQGLAWNQNLAFLDAWKKGETGFPIIDAAMKQLNTTGWMHNRLRMVVASFLTKDLLIDWRYGERYFEAQLIDYDPASNIGSWQWAASTGTDAVPYFRIFNPTKQSERFDAEGLFIKTYLPQLKNVPTAYIHEPSKMPLLLQEEVGCIIGEDYPFPIVEHAKMREEVLAMFKGK